MRMERARHVDCSAPDASGAVDYHYEYDIYRFMQGARCLVARSYVDTPDEAHFLSIEVGGMPRLLKRGDLLQSLCLFAQAELRREGKQQLHWLSGKGNGYEPVPDGSAAAGSGWRNIIGRLVK
ncbi:hypothetical protein [Xanthomonas vesicatoria]|uniref:hypothetical protein n=1 Tax=Xanthomonas vesicatoria TaxID=56460 RepID=UPI001E37E7A6|nr:hypothetical protein [Xanthomonas vesicatoria]MCC8619067.1 hypothetical protein [Xanthomonas vesicatoria]MCC8632649.1 hypothetical protein [Xanthomonas vesicatoria]